jgi:hypothetical protein
MAAEKPDPGPCRPTGMCVVAGECMPISSLQSAERMAPSPNGALLRGCGKRIAFRGGNVFRPVFGVRNRTEKRDRSGATSRITAFCE